MSTSGASLVLQSMQRHKAFIALAIVCLLPAFACGLVTPFPQSDDCLFVWSIETFCKSGQIKFLATSPTCYLPIMLGALAWKIFGHSFQVLHLISLAFAFAAGAGCYMILAEFKLGKSAAAMGAALVWINPLIVNLSICYMTDLPALALNTWSIYFCQRGINSGKTKHWLACVLILAASLACRQTGLFILIALALVSLILIISKRRDGFVLALLLALPAFVYLICDHFVLHDTIYSQPILSYKQKLAETGKWLLSGGVEAYRFALLSCAETSCYLGFYLFPLLAPLSCAAALKKPLRAAFILALVGAVALTGMPLVMVLQEHKYMPYSFSMLELPYVGNYCIFHNFIIKWQDYRQVWVTIFCDFAAFLFSLLFWLNFQLLCFSFGGSLLKKHKWRRATHGVAPTNSGGRLATDSIAHKRALFYLFSLIIFAGFEFLLVLQSKVMNFDRYNLALLVPAIVICAFGWRLIASNVKGMRICIWSLLTCLFIYTNTALIDFTLFNRCRWNVIHHIENLGVAPQDIDGGPEYCLLANPALFSKELKVVKSFIDEWEDGDRGGAAQAPFRWWPVTRTTYIVSDQGFENYTQEFSQSYWSPIDWRWKTIVALRKNQLNK